MRFLALLVIIVLSEIHPILLWMRFFWVVSARFSITSPVLVGFTDCSWIQGKVWPKVYRIRKGISL
jgi:hypothetical protein